MDEFHLFHNDEQIGPFTEQEIRGFLDEGRIESSILAWQDGAPEWKPLSEILKASTPNSNQSPPPMQLPQQQQVQHRRQTPHQGIVQTADQAVPMKSKGVALVLCLLFGWLGIHRFYVGRWFTGILQVFTFGGFFVWWTIDLLMIVCGRFKDAFGVVVGQPSLGLTNQGVHKSVTDSSTIPSYAPAQDWVMKAKPTPYWKFLLGANLFKFAQLNYVEKKGDIITVAVQSGKVCNFRIGEFKGKYVKTKEGIREFTLKSTIGPAQKVIFREVFLQMPEKWWDDLAEKLNTSESGLSKLVGGVRNVMGELS
jgi:TM2 domain-containing membrane protein YozV